MVSGGSIRLAAPNVAFHTPQEVSVYRTSVHTAMKEAMLRPKGTGKNPPTGGGDSSFTMNYEFNALGGRGVLCGIDFTTYTPFQDAPEQVDLPGIKVVCAGLLGNIIAGLAVEAVVVSVATLAASTVFSGGATAALAPWIIGGNVGLVGTAAVLATVNGTNSGSIDIYNGMQGTTTGAGTGMPLLHPPHTASFKVSSYASYGMSVFGKIMYPETLTSVSKAGFYLTTEADAVTDSNPLAY